MAIDMHLFNYRCLLHRWLILTNFEVVKSRILESPNWCLQGPRPNICSRCDVLGSVLSPICVLGLTGMSHSIHVKVTENRVILGSKEERW